jgi:SNF2 family DNA or RNA helicase
MSLFLSQVLKDLPNKHERIEWCEMTGIQKRIYRDAIARSRKTIFDADASAEPGADATDASRRKQAKAQKGRSKDKRYLENSTNVLMDLRKAASHPMLFRKLFNDNVLDAMTRQLMKEPDFRTRGAVAQYVKEDMEVMTDAELQLFAKTYKVIALSCTLDMVWLIHWLVDTKIPSGRKMLSRCGEDHGSAQVDEAIQRRGTQNAHLLSGLYTYELDYEQLFMRRFTLTVHSDP